MRFELIRMLVVDDNQHMRTLLSEVLRAIGVTHVHEASDGAMAMQILHDSQIDIVMCDLQMKPMDGIEFVQKLRNDPDSPNSLAPVIMVTGHSTGRQVKAARDAGVNEFLAKPVTARGVLQRMVQVVEQPRPFVRAPGYFGPDRRRRADPAYSGPRRRSADGAA